MKKINFKIIIFTILVFGFYHSANASLFSVNTNISEVKTGGLVTATVLLDSESKSINTIEGDLVYDNKSLVAERVNIGNSFISFWVEKPTVSNSGRIHFSGIVPGGLTMANSEVFSVVFRGQNAGDSKIEVGNALVYLSDGLGTQDRTIAKNIILGIVKSDTNDIEKLDNTDNVPPQGFKITRTRDGSLFDGKYFIVFSSQDKGTGIDHYNVCEYTTKECIISDSPYLLNYQNPFYRIIVRAYDVNGNMEEVILTSPLLMLSVIILIILILKSILLIYHRYLKKNRL